MCTVFVSIEMVETFKLDHVKLMFKVEHFWSAGEEDT
jgi:hypothetical protein